ncbi:MAG: hypothetical protein Q7S07_03635 [Candidatus Omnitrophota bacterium]|nr:hypothetical protein [Candidatus Omnitrophota bacterium]
MIKINLLPEELKKEDKSFSKTGFSLKGKMELFKNVAIAAALILAAAHIVFFFVGKSSSAAFKKLTLKYNQLSPGKKEYESLKAAADLTDKKAKAIDDLMTGRFIWAIKLNSLSDCMVGGIWLTEISYEEKPSEVTVSSGAKKEPAKAKAEVKKVNLRYLIISGYATSMGEQGTSLVGQFIKSMKDDPLFYSDFSEIKLESMKSEKVLEQEAMSFKITCLFKNR